MHIWNYIFHNSNIASLMNIYQGIMLWAVIALSVYALNGKKSLIGFEYYRGLSNEQIQNIVESVNAQDTDLSQEIEEINRVIKKVSETEKSNMPAQKIGGKINMRQMTEKEKFEPKKTENKTEYEQSAQHGSQEENAGR